MYFKILNSTGRLFNSMKCKVHNEVKTTWHLRDSAVVLSTVAQPLIAPLPQLPVPTLLATFQKYLKSVRPLVSEHEYMQTEKAVREFISSGSIGEKLQFLLEERAKNTENWLSDWWLKTAYLEYRSPLVIFSSPGLVFPPRNIVGKKDQLRCAAQIIAAALDFKKMIDERKIPLEMMGKKPLDMSQYFKILSTCRIPGTKRDALHHYGTENNPPTHVVIIHNNQFFKLEVYGDNSQILSENQIESFLSEVVSQSSQPVPPVGLLTTENRDSWAKSYAKLAKEKQNRNSLEEIQRSIFVVCLDQPTITVNPVDGRTRAALQLTHGCGSNYNSGNRWFDKTVQFIIGMDGEVGLTYEHSPAEGPPIAHLMDHIHTFTTSRYSDIPASNPLPPKRLDFIISEDTKADIKTAAHNIDNLIADLQMTSYKFVGYGKNFIKSQKLSPDSYIQMAIQLAFFRIHKEPGACYESASTRQFLHGRTENIRSTSLESLAFCKAMMDDKPDQDKIQLLRKAIESHKRYVVDAINGHGVDRHLLGLKLIALENGMDVPQLMLDAGFKKSSHFRISTSQVTSKCDGFMCYGPLVPNGYACCYNPLEKEINFGLSAHVSCPETSSEVFRDALEKSLTDMHNVLILNQSSKL